MRAVLPHAPPETAEAMLETLGAELRRLGWTARLIVTAGQPPALRVANPAAAQLTDDIRVAPRVSGQPSYSWSWGDPVRAATPGEAGELICRALRATGR